MADSVRKLYEAADEHYYAERLDEAEALYQRILDQDPLHQGALHSLGIVHYDRDEYAPAIDFLLKALAVDPSDQYVHSNLGKALYGLHHMGERQEAARIAKEWIDRFPENPIARHMAAAVTGEAPPERANDAYIRKTFDEFADSFDAKLEELDYRAPRLIVGALGPFLAKGGLPEGDLRVLDAGCGTGLAGPHLRPLAARLDGVDLSGEMLAKARARKLYDRLSKRELTEALATRRRRYDLVVCADTLCYFGALDDILAAFFAALKPGGLAGLSLEHARVAGFTLDPSGRYRHGLGYVRGAVKAAGFEILADTIEVLRTEYAKPVKGLVMVCRRPV